MVPGTGELGYQFINHIRRPITVITRTGIRLTIPYTPWHHNPNHRAKKGLYTPAQEPCFIIRARIGTHHDVILDTSELSNDHGSSTSLEAQAYTASVQVMEDSLVRRTQSMACVEYRIPEEDFDANNGVLYLQNIDLQISILTAGETPPHPHSMLGVRNRDAHEFKQELASAGVFYGIYIRDQCQEFGERYVNVNGSVMHIPVRNDTDDKRDGVYIVTAGKLTSQVPHERVLVEYYPFEEANDKIGLYKTYAEALTLGNPEERMRRELEEKKQQLAMEELEWKRERARHERQVELERDQMRTAMMEYEFQLSRLNQLNKLFAAELERREMQHRREMAIIKDILGARDHERRESMEILKLIPTIITTVATYVVAYKKLKAL